MADVSIDATISTATARGLRSVVFTDASNGYWVFIDSDGGLAINKTTDGGASWSLLVNAMGDGSSTDIAFDIWYDQWTPGDTGTLIYIWWFGSGIDDIQFIKFDTATDTQSGSRTTIALTSAVAGRGAFVSGTKTRSGYLYCAYDIDAGAERGLRNSTDSGATWSSNLSTTFVGATIDQCLLFPATGTGDNNDMIAVMQIAATNALGWRHWDNSAATFNSAFSFSLTENTTDLTGQMGFSASVRHSDGRIIVVWFTERDTTTADCMAISIAGDGTASSALTNITTDKDDIYYPAVFIDQNTDDIYVAHNGARDGGENLGAQTIIYYTKSTDGGTTWGASVPFQEGASSANIQVWAPLSGNRFYVGWRVGTTLVGNFVNSLDLTPTSGVSGSATDAFSASDSVTRLVTNSRTVSDTSTFAQVATRIMVMSRNISDTSTFGESAVKVISKPRSATDSFSSGDTATRLATYLRSIADAGTYVDAATRTNALFRVLTNAGTYSDTATRIISKMRSATDSFTAVDAATRFMALLRSVTDSSNWVDVATQVKEGGAAIARDAVDAFTSSDAVTRVVQVARTVSNASTYSDAATRFVTALRSVANTATQSDAATRIASFTRTVSNGAIFTETSSRLIVLFRTVTDANTWADVATQIKSGGGFHVRTAADAFTASEVAVRLVSVFRTVTNSGTYSDAATRVVALFRTLSNTGTYSQVATRGIERVRSVADAFNASQVATQLRSLARSVSDTLTATEVATQFRLLFRSLTDAQSFSDVAIAIKNLVTTFFRAGQRTGSTPRIKIAGSSAEASKAGSQLDVERTD